MRYYFSSTLTSQQSKPKQDKIYFIFSQKNTKEKKNRKIKNDYFSPPADCTSHIPFRSEGDACRYETLRYISISRLSGTFDNPETASLFHMLRSAL